MKHFESTYSRILDYWSCGKDTTSYPIDDDLPGSDSDSLAISPWSSGSTCTSEKRGSCISSNIQKGEKVMVFDEETFTFKMAKPSCSSSNIKKGNKALHFDEDTFCFKMGKPE
jgi:hypothetical protein